jgi:ribose 5-phosphate isomerase RpiB
MKIAIITEVSTKQRNPSILEAFRESDYEIFNVGMQEDTEDFVLSYVHTAFMTAFLLEIEAVDFVIGGCGTGQGYAIAANKFPGVHCGLIYDPLEAWLFPQVNAGNAISIPLNKQFGWAGDQNLKLIFSTLFSVSAGEGYPKERERPQREARNLLSTIASTGQTDSMSSFIDQCDFRFLKTCAASSNFMQLISNTKTTNVAKTLFLNRILSR